MVIARTLALAVALAALAAPARAQEHDTPTPPMNKWSFAGPFGKFDRGQLQRGFKVYREVCQVCHGLKLVAFRTLAEPGGPGFTTAQAAAIAAEYQVPAEPDDQGEVKPRPARLADYFPPPFPNEQAARARYNAVPPDLSVIAKARGYERGFPRWVGDMFTQYQEQGVDYITALLQGYQDSPPAGVHAAARKFLQQVLSRPRHRDAAAAVRPARRIHRRRADDGRTVFQGHLGVSDVDGRAAPRGQEADRHAGGDLSDRAVRAALLHQEEGLARREAASGEAHAAPAAEYPRT